MADDWVAMDDDELEWMASLDWSAHGARQQRDVVPKGTVPLAHALRRLAEMAVDDWPVDAPKAHFLQCAGLPPRRHYPNAEFAFDERGRPFSSIHDAYADEVRRDAVHCMVPLRSRTSVSRREWSDVERAVEDDWQWGMGARRVWSSVAPAFAAAAASGRIVTRAHRATGVVHSGVIRAERWQVDFRTAVLRAASCTMAAADVDGVPDPEGTPCAILVDGLGLVPALQAVARENYATHMDLREVGRLPRPIDDLQPPERLLLGHLIELMRSNSAADTTRDELRDELGRAFATRVEVRQFRRLWENAKDSDPEGKNYGYGRPGRKPDAPAALRLVSTSQV